MFDSCRDSANRLYRMRTPAKVSEDTDDTTKHTKCFFFLNNKFTLGYLVRFTNQSNQLTYHRKM